MALAKLIAQAIAGRVVEFCQADRKGIEETIQELSSRELARFNQKFTQQKKSLAIGYLCCLGLGCHYGYVGRWWVQTFFWLSFGGLFFWWFMDFFTLYFLIESKNYQIKNNLLTEIENFRRLNALQPSKAIAKAQPLVAKTVNKKGEKGLKDFLEIP